MDLLLALIIILIVLSFAGGLLIHPLVFLVLAVVVFLVLVRGARRLP